jgi:hypothetical protein
MFLYVWARFACAQAERKSQAGLFRQAETTKATIALTHQRKQRRDWLVTRIGG